VPFATTYLCESRFSSLFDLKKHRSRLKPSNNLHVTLSNCVPRYERIISGKQQQKKSLGLFLMSIEAWKLVFSVVLSVCLDIASRNSTNEDTAKSDCFCDFYAHVEWGGAIATFLLWKGWQLKIGWQPKPMH